MLYTAWHQVVSHVAKVDINYLPYAAGLCFGYDVPLLTNFYHKAPNYQITDKRNIKKS